MFLAICYRTRVIVQLMMLHVINVCLLSPRVCIFCCFLFVCSSFLLTLLFPLILYLVVPEGYHFHWLLIRSRLHFKIFVLTFRALHGQAPPYIADLIHIYTSLVTSGGPRCSPTLISELEGTDLSLHPDCGMHFLYFYSVQTLWRPSKSS